MSADWQPARPVDVIVSNAVLQWMPDPRGCCPALGSQLAGGGWLAFQVPGNFDQPTHRSCASWPGRPAGGRCSAT